MIRQVYVALIILLLATLIRAETTPPPSEAQQADLRNIKVSGPRVGAVYLSGKALEKELKDHDINNIISLFGWHFEWKRTSPESHASFLFAVIPMVGGFESGKALPTCATMVGIRSPNGYEFGVGPNFSTGMSSVIVTLGRHFYWEGLPLSINVSNANNREGNRASLTVGLGMF